MHCNDDGPATLGLFSDSDLQQPARVEVLGPESRVLRGFALPWVEALLPQLDAVLAAAPFRPVSYTHLRAHET